MYVRERIRVYLTYTAGVLIGLSGLAIVVMALGKISYNDPFLGWIGALLYYHFPPFHWAWPWLPDVGATPGMMLLNVPTLLGMFLFLVGGFSSSNALKNHSIINEAARAAVVAGLLGGRSGISYKQSAEQISAGRDITILQIADRKLDDWTHNFWKGPAGALVLAVAASIIAAILTKLTGLAH
jgi:hypothetical protein